MLNYKYDTGKYHFYCANDFFANGKIQYDMSYQDLISYLYPWDKKYKNDLQIRDITFQVTDACNLACSYCYQINKGHHKMPIEVAKKFIDLLIENKDGMQQYMNTTDSFGCVVDFIGGEPLLEVELIDQIIDYFEAKLILEDHPWQYHHVFSFSTNGTLYFEPKVQEFIEKHKHHLSINVTIDGNKELHDSCRRFPDGSGSYDLAFAAVEHLRKHHGCAVGSKLTISPDNVSYLYSAITHMFEHGYNYINLNCIYEKGWEPKHATILYYELKKIADYIFENNLENICGISLFKEYQYCDIANDDDMNWCGGNGAMIAIDYKGDIYPCLRYMESSLGNDALPIIIGNIDTGILVTEEQRNVAMILQSINRINQSTEECINCPIASGCAWCQAYNYQDSGEFFHRATYICDMHKATSLANVYYWNMKYKKLHQSYSFKMWLPEEEIKKILPNDELQLLQRLVNESHGKIVNNTKINNKCNHDCLHCV